MKSTTVFLSHSWGDKRFVRRLAKRLDQEGVSVWVDEAQINVGDSLIQKISQAIERTDYVAAVISAKSVKSEWVQKELHLAMSKEISGRRVVVLPLLLEHCDLPSFLKDKVYADFREPKQFKQAFLKVLKAIGIDQAKSYKQQAQRRSPRKTRSRGQITGTRDGDHTVSTWRSPSFAPPSEDQRVLASPNRSTPEYTCHSCGAEVSLDADDQRSYHCNNCGASNQWSD